MGDESSRDGPGSSGQLRVEPGAGGQRLDRFLARALDLPRNQVQRWIRDGRVLVDERPVKPSAHLEGGETVQFRPPPPPSAGLSPEAGPLTLLHEDPHLLALDKPPGLTVHPGAGRPTGTLVHRLLARYPELDGVGGPGRPGIVHRLDKDTSGVLLVARTALAYRRLTRAFAARRVHKSYLAVVHGRPTAPRFTIDAPIGRHPTRRRQMTVRSDGRPAITEATVLEEVPALALLEVRILTGRTHQIRVHLKSRRHPLVGDPVYGEARGPELRGPARHAVEAFPRPALHAWRLELDHPDSGARLRLEAPPAEDLVELWRAVGGRWSV